MCLCVLVCVLITSLSLFVVAIVYLSLIIMIITIFYHHKPTQIYIIYKSSKLVFIWSLLSLSFSLYISYLFRINSLFSVRAFAYIYFYFFPTLRLLMFVRFDFYYIMMIIFTIICHWLNENERTKGLFNLLIWRSRGGWIKND